MDKVHPQVFKQPKELLYNIIMDFSIGCMRNINKGGEKERKIMINVATASIGILNT